MGKRFEGEKKVNKYMDVGWSGGTKCSVGIGLWEAI